MMSAGILETGDKVGIVIVGHGADLFRHHLPSLCPCNQPLQLGLYRFLFGLGTELYTESMPFSK